MPSHGQGCGQFQWRRNQSVPGKPELPVRQLSRQCGRPHRVSLSSLGDNGHWVGMSYEHSSLLFSERRWHFKDSCKPGDVESLSSLEAMGKLEVPDKSGCGWFIVVDCA